MSVGGSLCRMILLLYAAGIEGGLYDREEAPVPPRGGPCAAERGPCAERRPSVPKGILS